jgi:hypothetical protein
MKHDLRALGVSQLSLLNRTRLTKMISRISVRKAWFRIPPTVGDIFCKILGCGNIFWNVRDF